MSPYLELLHVARQQAAAVARGELGDAVALLDARGALLAQAAAPVGADFDAIREVLRLDRELSGAIRERMLHIRDEALAEQRGRQALSSYAPPPAAAVPTIDRAS